MNLSVHITKGEPFNVAIAVIMLGARYSTTATATELNALVDCSLWWAFNRMLDRFVSSAVPPAVLNRKQFPEVQALEVGEALVHYVFTCRFHESDEERGARIVNTIHNRLPEIAPLIHAGSDLAQRTEAFEQVKAMAMLIRDRITIGGGDPMHGIAAFTTVDEARNAA